jgi:hypothetical protein
MLTVQTNTTSDGRVRLANYSIYSPTLRGDVTEGGEPGALVFDTRVHVSWWPETNFSEWVCKPRFTAYFQICVHHRPPVSFLVCVCVCVLSHWVRTAIGEVPDLPSLKCSSHWSLGLYSASVFSCSRSNECVRSWPLLGPHDTRNQMLDTLPSRGLTLNASHGHATLSLIQCHTCGRYKTSVIGRFTRAVAVSAWDVDAKRGFAFEAVPNTRRGINTDPYDMAELLVSFFSFQLLLRLSAFGVQFVFLHAFSCLPHGSPNAHDFLSHTRINSWFFVPFV